MDLYSIWILIYSERIYAFILVLFSIVCMKVDHVTTGYKVFYTKVSRGGAHVYKVTSHCSKPTSHRSYL
jgi:hypothetical protein